MLDRTQKRALPLLNKGVELTPALNAGCGVCRTCGTTNVVTLAMTALSGAALCVARLVKRGPSRELGPSEGRSARMPGAQIGR